MSRDPVQDEVIEEAILWMVRLQSGEFCPQEQQELDRWRALSTRHEQAFQQLTGGLEQVQASPWRNRPGGQLLRAIEVPSSRRQFVRNSLAVAGLALGVGLIGRLSTAGLALPGDLYTATAERRSWQLEDGSRLDLNARSSVTPQVNGTQRLLRLRQGELLVQIAGDPRLPFLIDTAAGRIQANAGRILVREEADAIRLVTLDSNAQLAPLNASSRALDARQTLLFNRHGVLTQAPMQRSETAWLDGWLEVRNQPLSWVVQAIRPYRRGILRLDPAVANLRVSGLYPLDNTRQTLEMLASSLPISIVSHSEYWVSIGTAG
jgi:transmembrane sensor